MLSGWFGCHGLLAHAIVNPSKAGDLTGSCEDVHVVRTCSGLAEAEGTSPSKADSGLVFGTNTLLAAAEAEGSNPLKAAVPD